MQLKRSDPGYFGLGKSSQLKTGCPLSPQNRSQRLQEKNLLWSFLPPIRSSISKTVYLRATSETIKSVP